MRLVIDSIRRSFDGTPVLQDISFTLAPGTIGCLLGPSGCGKTTLLRIIAGFETADTGRVLADDRVLTDSGVRLPPHERRIGMVFQDHALFPHLDVLANVAFGLHHRPKAERDARARELI
ncbi:MAG: ATP-binding cassette domain-containing protein, partial [Gammaproteobacteria bacterium]